MSNSVHTELVQLKKEIVFVIRFSQWELKKY